MTNFNGTTLIFDSWKEKIAKSVDVSTDLFKMILCGVGYTPDLASDQILADVTSEVSGNGYARQTLQGVSFNLSGGEAKFVSDPIVFSAVGGSITARRWVLFDESAASDPLVCCGLLDSSGSDVVITDGNTLTISLPASGLFVLS